MTVQEVLDALQDKPRTMDVYVDPRVTDFKFGLVNSLRMEEIPMTEHEDGSGLSATETVIILDEQ